MYHEVKTDKYCDSYHNMTLDTISRRFLVLD